MKVLLESRGFCMYINIRVIKHILSKKRIVDNSSF